MFLRIQDWPPLAVVGFVSLMGLVAGYTIMGIINTSVKIKNKATKETVLFTVWTTIFCMIISWACIFLGQAKPMISPDFKNK
ncbi:uncharacterized protein NESG_01421 [Nematocida ausubeli]|uniref:Uncharacterized protein n=1 Tax=Nematocida ausubeli (strain ATCC PRA-371 / ERTm2) TaxID=1913371 RepID=H8ZAX8_NEMA1|nr:uncharacterized protein NESG_01421 [Nematocida ausubeli]EHY66031.1 hypothetical protein NERG_00727 [Nematocida ausubeli]KAI5132546.1 hypothetical protein NEAUS06_0195 [Nematocida ausubeli]KAI5150853.1 hypothetical protein NEAUS05_2318 [Nematocida ausubeli]KAI5151433.1 hypothetical protein NEAUS05_2494 [Nematocida ausubeli]KFG26301.1 hypothetical protein NESG_01421 [Nematocida ausubeli]